jgi:hypothetical protein
MPKSRILVAAAQRRALGSGGHMNNKLSEKLLEVKNRLKDDAHFAEVTISRRGKNLKGWLPRLSWMERKKAYRFACSLRDQKRKSIESIKVQPKAIAARNTPQDNTSSPEGKTIDPSQETLRAAKAREEIVVIMKHCDKPDEVRAGFLRSAQIMSEVLGHEDLIKAWVLVSQPGKLYDSQVLQLRDQLLHDFPIQAKFLREKATPMLGSKKKRRWIATGLLKSLFGPKDRQYSKLPEERKMEIYKDLREERDSIFLCGITSMSDSDAVTIFQGGFQEIEKHANKTGKGAEERAIATISSRHKISTLEARLIFTEGEKKKWPFREQKLSDFRGKGRS